MFWRSLVVLLVVACAESQAAPVAVITTATATTATATTATATTPAPTIPPTTPETPTTIVARLTPEKGWLLIHGVGDVNLDPSYIPALSERGFDWAWSGLDGLFLEDDLTVINLECAPSPLGVAEGKEFTFQCPDGMREMSSAGIEVANLGNNHSQDFGKEAMLDGRQRLIEAGLSPIGVGANANQAAQFAAFETGGWKVAVLGFGGIRPNDGWLASADSPGMADGDNIETMTATVRAADEWADWVMVAIHWGVELDRQPRAEDRERAGAMIAAGADVIFGHHSHRLQPFEMVGDSAVFWSLGNFAWPNFSAAGSETAVGRVVISPAGRLNACLVPAQIESAGHPVLTGEPACSPEP